MQLSVIICTHNPRADFLRRTLEALKEQTLPGEQWEFLLIDNASKDPLAEIWDLSLLPNARHVREEALGLTRARLRGIREAAGDVIVFVDDDNVLCRSYLASCLEIMRLHPWLGCIGAGRLEPEFEEAPASELESYCRYLALRTVQGNLWSNTPGDNSTPWGAGLSVRRAIAEAYVRKVTECPFRMRLGRKGKNLIAGEDDEFSWVACESGLGKGIFPILEIRHLIDRKRVQVEYLERLIEGHGYSVEWMKYIHGQAGGEGQQVTSGAFAWLRGLEGWFRGAVGRLFRDAQGQRRYCAVVRMQKARVRGRVRAERDISEGMLDN